MSKANVINYDNLNISIGRHNWKFLLLVSDSEGRGHKRYIKHFLNEQGYNLKDLGTFDDRDCDYIPFSNELGKALSYDRLGYAGIGFCGSGSGILEVALKYPGVYGRACLSVKQAKRSRIEDNSNILGISVSNTPKRLAKKIVDVWLNTEFYPNKSHDHCLERVLEKMKLEREIYTNPKGNV